MKKGLGIILIIISIFTVSLIFSAPVEDNLHLNIQVTNSSNDILTGTFSFVFNISTSSDCNNIVYTNSSTLTTDSRGVISYYLTNTNLNYSEQYWLCYYRNGVLINASKIAQVPYAFRARNVTLSGVDVDTNFVIGIYNITAGIGNFGAGLVTSGYRLNVIGNVNFTGNLTLGKGTIAYNTSSNQYIYWNTTDWIQFGIGAGGSTVVTQVPAGSIMAFNSASCPTGWVLADGTSGTPDLRGLYIRGAGTNSILQYANASLGNFSATFGTYQNDSFQGHKHGFGVYSRWYGSTSAILFPSGADSGPDDTKSVSSPTTDGTSGTPRTGAETAPASYVLTYCMKTTEDTPVSNTIWGSSGDNIFVQNMSLNVGIGTTSPGEKLDVNGSVYLSAASTESRGIEIGKGRTGDGSSRINLIGDANYTDYGLRLIRVAGANSNSQLGHRGTGGLQIWATDAGTIRFGTSNTERMRIIADGSVGIGTTTPSMTLEVAGNTTVREMINLQVRTLPTCTTVYNGSIMRNATGVYGCSSNTIWTKLF